MSVERLRQHAATLLACAEARERGAWTPGDAATAARLRQLASALQRAANQAEALQRQYGPLRQQATALQAEALTLQRWRPRG